MSLTSDDVAAIRADVNRVGGWHETALALCDALEQAWAERDDMRAKWIHADETRWDEGFWAGRSLEDPDERDHSFAELQRSVTYWQAQTRREQENAERAEAERDNCRAAYADLRNEADRDAERAERAEAYAVLMADGRDAVIAALTERAERAEAERDVYKSGHGHDSALCMTWRERAERAEQNLREYIAQRHWAIGAVARVRALCDERLPGGVRKVRDIRAAIDEETK